ALLAQDQARRRGNLTLGDDAGRHLVQQRLEQMVGRPRDQLDIDIGTFQGLGGVQPTETRPDDDDLMPIRCRGSGVAHYYSSRTYSSNTTHRVDGRHPTRAVRWRTIRKVQPGDACAPRTGYPDISGLR